MVQHNSRSAEGRAAVRPPLLEVTDLSVTFPQRNLPSVRATPSTASSSPNQRIPPWAFRPIIPIAPLPNVYAVKTGLVNYGAEQFETVDWTLVGWKS